MRRCDPTPLHSRAAKKSDVATSVWAGQHYPTFDDMAASQLKCPWRVSLQLQWLLHYGHTVTDTQADQQLWRRCSGLM